MSNWDAGGPRASEMLAARRSALVKLGFAALGKVTLKPRRLGIARGFFVLVVSRGSFGLMSSPDNVNEAVAGTLLAVLYGLAYPVLNQCFSTLFILFMMRAEAWSAYRRVKARSVLVITSILQFFVQLVMDILRSAIGLNPSENVWLKMCQIYFILFALGLSGCTFRCWFVLPRETLHRLRREFLVLLTFSFLMSFNAILVVFRNAFFPGVNFNRLTADETNWLLEISNAACGAVLAIALCVSVTERMAELQRKTAAEKAVSFDLPRGKSLDNGKLDSGQDLEGNGYGHAAESEYDTPRTPKSLTSSIAEQSV